MTDIINLLTQNGIGIVCVAYMIYFQNTTMKKIAENMNENNKVLQSIDVRLSEIEKRSCKKCKVE